MTNWQTGDVITAEKLNDLESRADRILIVRTVFDDSIGMAVMDKTWQEIHDALSVGKIVINHNVRRYDGEITTDLASEAPAFVVSAINPSDYVVYTIGIGYMDGDSPEFYSRQLICDSTSGYPSFDIGD